MGLLAKIFVGAVIFSCMSSNAFPNNPEQSIKTALTTARNEPIKIGRQFYPYFQRFEKYVDVEGVNKSTRISDLVLTFTAVNGDCIYAKSDCLQAGRSKKAPQELLVPFDITPPELSELQTSPVGFTLSFEFYLPNDKASREAQTMEVFALQSGGGRNVVKMFINSDKAKYRKSIDDDKNTGLLFADLTNKSNSIDEWFDKKPYLRSLELAQVYGRWHAVKIESRWSVGEEGFVRIFVNDHIVSSYRGPTLNAEAIDRNSRKKFRPNFRLGMGRKDINRSRLLKAMSNSESDFSQCLSSYTLNRDDEEFSQRTGKAKKGYINQLWANEILESNCAKTLTSVVLSEPSIKFRKLRIESEAFTKTKREVADVFDIPTYEISGEQTVLTPLSHDKPYAFTLDRDVKRLGSVAQRFEVRHGDCSNFTDPNGYSDCNADRARVWASQRQNFVNKAAWYGFSLLIPEEYIDIDPAGVGIAEVTMAGYEDNIWRIELKDGNLRFKSVTSDQTCDADFGSVESLKGDWLDFAIGLDYGVSTGFDSGVFDGSYADVYMSGERFPCYFGKPLITQQMTEYGLRELNFKWGLYGAFLSRWLDKNKKSSPDVIPYTQKSIGSGSVYKSITGQPFKYDWGVKLPTNNVYIDEIRVGKNREEVDISLLEGRIDPVD